MSKKILFLLAVAALSTLAAAPLRSDLDPKLPRRISVTKGNKYVIDKNVKILLPPKSTRTAKFAAEELAQFLSRAFGAPVAIVAAPPEKGLCIAVGDNAYAKALGIDTSKFDRDGFAIKSGKNMIVIAGRDDAGGDPALKNNNYFEHATLFGVYDFLERFAGVRFYFPGRYGEVVPRTDRIALGDIDIYDRPDHFQRRSQEFHNAWYDDGTGKDVPVARYDAVYGKVRYDNGSAKGGPVLQDYRRRSQTFYVPCCHSLEQSGYYRRFAKTHPEYFAKDPQGKLYPPNHWSVGSGCYLSEGYRNEIYLDGVSYLKGEPASKRGVLRGGDRSPNFSVGWAQAVGQPGYFSIMPGDHHRRCLCDKCKAYMAKYGENEYVWDMVTDIAERIRKTPGVKGKVTAMAYARYTEPPKRPIPANMEIMVAVSGPWAEQNADLRKAHDERIRAWTRKLGGRKVWLWTYPHKLGNGSGGFQHPGIPQMAPRTVGKYYKRQAPFTFGAFYESESDKWLFNYLNTYVFFKQAWDNSVDIDALVDEHHKAMFGAAAPEMDKFYRELEEIWMTKLLGKIVETPLGPVTTPPTVHEVWEKIYSPAKLKSFEELFDRAERKVSGETCERVKFIRKQFLGSLLENSAKYFREKNALADWSYFVKPLGPNEKITVDGWLDDPAWKNAEVTYLLPVTGDVCEVKTVVRGRTDKDCLYFGFECMEPKMDEIWADRLDRDHKDLWMDSAVEFFFNPSGNGKDYYQFIVNSKGIVSDLKNIRVGSASKHDINWTSKAQIAAKALKDRFIIEVAVPKAELAGFDPKNFRANFCRHRALRKTKVLSRYYTWSPNHIGYHEVENYGRLTFEKEPDGNMIRNGDFTAPYQRTWSVNTHGPGGPEFDENIFITGGRSARLNAKDGGFKWIYQGLPLKSNTTYAVSFYMKMENVQPTASYGGFQLLLGDNNNNFMPKNPYTGTMPWTRQGFFWTTGPDGGKVLKGRSRCIRFGIRNARGVVWIDNVKFSEVPKK